MELLISNGHDPQQVIHEYTLDQIDLYARLVLRRQAAERLRTFEIVALAQRGQKRQVTQWMNANHPRRIQLEQDPDETPADRLARQLRGLGLVG